MKVFTSIILLAAIFSVSGMAQTSLAGKILDADTGEELIAANCTVFRNGVLITGVATDFEGNYHLKIDPGIYAIEVSYIGYQTCRIEGIIVAEGKKNKLDVLLGTGGGIQLSQNFRMNKRQYKKSKPDAVLFNIPPEENLVRELLENEPAQ